MGTPTPVRNRDLKQSKIMQSIKILIAVLALAGAVYSQEDTVVPEVSSVEETATPVLTSHAKSALIEESSTALSEAHAHLHNDLSHIFKVDQNTQFMSTALLKTITKNRQDFDNDMELWGFVKKAASAVSNGVASVGRSISDTASKAWGAVKGGASAVWSAAKKAGSWAYAQLKKAAAALCRKGLAYVAGRAIDELFKKAIQVCAQLCVRVASYIAVSGGANPASIAVAAAIGSGCGFACKSAADYLRKVMNNNQLTDTVFANWVCNKLGLTGKR